MITLLKHCYNCGLGSSDKKDANEIHCEKLRDSRMLQPFKCKIPKYYIKREKEVRKNVIQYLEESEKNHQTNIIIQWTIFCCLLSILAGLLISQYAH